MLSNGPPQRASKSIPRIHLQTMSRTSAARSGSNCSSLMRGKRRSKRLSRLLHPLRRMSQKGSLGRSPLGPSRLSASPQRSVKALRIWNVSPARLLLSLGCAALRAPASPSRPPPAPSCDWLPRVPPETVQTLFCLLALNQSNANPVCINHGSTVSLFHRLRSQTVSTKYLCVSGSGASFKGSDGQSLPGIDPRARGGAPSFVARTGTWGKSLPFNITLR